MNRIMDVETVLRFPQVLVGHIIPHPECPDILLTITRVNNVLNATWDDNNIWRNYLLVCCEDGEWYRYWLNSNLEIPKVYED